MNRKHTLSIAGVVATGAVLAALIMTVEPGKSSSAGGHAESGGDHAAGAPHSDAKGHGDKEHHGAKADDGHGHAGEHKDGEHHAQSKKGSNGGELFTEGTFGLEVLMQDEPSKAGAAAGARLRAFLFENGKPLPPSEATVEVTITRPSGEKQAIALKPEGNALVSTSTISAPHVFDATVAAQRRGEPYLFNFSKEEGLVKLTEEQLRSAGVTLDTAAPARLVSAVTLPGEIRLNEDRTAHVVPRVAGVIESVTATLGQRIRKGQVLATIASTAVSEQRSELAAAQRRLDFARTQYEREKKLWEEKISAEQDFQQARQSLQEAEIAAANARQKLAATGIVPAPGAGNRFELRAPFDGTVVEKHVALGEAVKEDTNLFTLADLSSVWAIFNVPAKDLAAVRVGERATVRATALASEVAGTVSYVGNLIGEQTRTANARVTVQNPQGAWRPGLFVNVTLAAVERSAPVTVATDAIQTQEGQPTVFVKTPGGFMPQPVQTGLSNGQRIEITQGLKPGTVVAASGSFVIKSEFGKGSATHSH